MDWNYVKHRKKEVLKLQIKFWKKVLGQTHENKDIFKFSKNKRQLSVLELKHNLLVLIGESEDAMDLLTISRSHIMAHPEVLIGKRIRHCFQVGDSLEWFNGTVISMSTHSMEFEVKYDKEEETCSFTLLDDVLSGDLELL